MVIVFLTLTSQWAGSLEISDRMFPVFQLTWKKLDTSRINQMEDEMVIDKKALQSLALVLLCIVIGVLACGGVVYWGP